MPDGYQLPARYYARLCEVLSDIGVDTDDLLAKANITRSELETADGSLSLQQVEALVDEAIRVTGRSDLGLEFARALKLTSHSTVSYAILSSPNAGYALRMVARFFSLILPSFRMDYAADDSLIRLSVTPVWPQSRQLLVLHLEVIAAAVYLELRELVGRRLPPCDLYYSFDEPPHAVRYEQLQEVQVHFGWLDRPGCRLEWPAEMAAWPLGLSDPTALKLAEQRCNELVDKARAMGHVGDWVRMMMREARDGSPSMEELAGALNLSTRTLDRYLKKEGTTFRELSNQAGHEKACLFLREQQMSVTQAAFELGYNDVSNFARAFRRIEGVSPGDWQRANT